MSVQKMKVVIVGGGAAGMSCAATLAQHPEKFDITLIERNDVTFLDQRDQHDLWTMGEIDESKIIERKWWHQLGHRWQHYVRIVPGMMFINGKNQTLFAGSWTLVNMHELACVSGIAAAYRLGAKYTKLDDFATDFFSKYLLLSHGMLYGKEEKRRKKEL